MSHWAHVSQNAQEYALSNRPTQKTQLEIHVGTETRVQESGAYMRQPGVNRQSLPADEREGSLEEDFKEPMPWDSKAHLTQG